LLFSGKRGDQIVDVQVLAPVVQASAPRKCRAVEKTVAELTGSQRR